MEHVRSSSSLSGGCLTSPTVRVAPRVSSNATVEATEGVASSFGIVILPLEESSGDSTPSQVYGRGSEDTQVAPPTLGRDAINLSFPFRFVCFFDCLLPVYMPSSPEQRGGEGCGGAFPEHAPLGDVSVHYSERREGKLEIAIFFCLFFVVFL